MRPNRSLSRIQVHWRVIIARVHFDSNSRYFGSDGSASGTCRSRFDFQRAISMVLWRGCDRSDVQMFC